MPRLTSALLASLFLAAGAGAAPRKPEAEIAARHQALVALFNRKDVKSARTFYTDDYVAEGGGKKQGRDAQLNALSELLKSGGSVRVRATLSQIAVKGNTATAIETADVSFKPAGAPAERMPRQRSQQRWRNAGGVWKLAGEKLLKPSGR